jgi:hypothetical protein
MEPDGIPDFTKMPRSVQAAEAGAVENETVSPVKTNTNANVVVRFVPVTQLPPVAMRCARANCCWEDVGCSSTKRVI